MDVRCRPTLENIGDKISHGFPSGGTDCEENMKTFY